MAENNGLDGDNQTIQEESTTSTSLALETEAPATAIATACSSTNEGQLDTEQQKSKKEESSIKTVPFYKLFSFADSVDVTLMIVGTIGAVGNGICVPIMTILFGELINSFGQNQNNKDVVHAVSKVALKFVYLASGSGVVSFLQTNTGEVVSRMSGDTVSIQDAMGEKVGKFIQLLVTFFGGFVVAFIKGWLLALVLSTSIPVLVIAGGIFSIFVSKVSSTSQNAYAKAAIVVEQTIGSIRTVASFTGEKHAITKYDKSLLDAYKSDDSE